MLDYLTWCLDSSGKRLDRCSSARNLGFTVLCIIFRDMLVSNVCRTAMFALHSVSTICQYPSVQTALIFAFVVSSLDNSLLSSCIFSTKSNSSRILHHSSYSKHTKLLYKLHWLPVQAFMEHKLAILWFRFFVDSASYFCDLQTHNISIRHLHISEDILYFS